ncbi:MAG: hypothetical protein M1813_000322 [Trichoglossum hirsutum]|jgi:hypothetical protein|nr:MAG: hypothetical protein M1813_000322 [Trichoglossum hirsutum]
MSDERSPPEMPILSASSPDTTQSQQHGQDGGQDNDSIIMSDELYSMEMPTFSASSPNTTQKYVSNGQDGGRDNNSIIMSDELYPMEMPTFSASSPNTTQKYVSNGQDGGRDNNSIIMSDELYPMEMPRVSTSGRNTTQNQQQAPDSQDEGQDTPEEPLRTITLTSPLLARHFADQMQNPVPYQQQRHLVVGNLQIPGPLSRVILSQSIRDKASSNMMIRSFVQAMDNMAEGRV